uniref:Uncharacterized protein n=1 Tax=Kalanchoe fedtschenkoi TaxID=63787 RepID=A0A7N1A5N4_KALFE
MTCQLPVDPHWTRLMTGLKLPFVHLDSLFISDMQVKDYQVRSIFDVYVMNFYHQPYIALIHNEKRCSFATLAQEIFFSASLDNDYEVSKLCTSK